ncbi:MAG: hypothetical protein DRO67_04330 [Candidatus Asgardarchaeum californiense]|nr:MAG: hypothetical protein DRO67_04330 [Candidatus Asgardarchaeum californiense]
MFSIQGVVMRKIVFIGVGDTGIKMVNNLKQVLDEKNAQFVGISTDKMILENVSLDDVFFVEIPGIDRIKAYDIYSEISQIFEKLDPIIENARLIFITAAFGGQTGTWGTVALAEKIRESFEIPVISLVFIPFKVDRIARMLAYLGLSKLSEISPSILPIDLEQMLHIMPEKDIEDVFEWIDDRIINIIRDLFLILEKSKTAPVSFESLLTQKYLTIGLIQLDEYTADALKKSLANINKCFFFSPPHFEDSSIFASILRSSSVTDSECKEVISILSQALSAKELHTVLKTERKLPYELEIILLASIMENEFQDIIERFEQEAHQYFKEMNISLSEFGITSELLP